MTQQHLLAILSGQARGPGPALVRGLLAALAPLYAWGAAAKNAFFDAGWLKASDLGRPAVSVGNLTTGGTGKTPMVAWVVHALAKAGHRPCVLLRGYKSQNGVSDEAQELHQRVGAVAQVAPHPDRVAEARRQLAAHPEITCFVLDDGFQHRRAKRDLDLVLVDATNPWGYGATLPRGLLREKKAGLRRADAVIVTRSDRVDAEALAQLGVEIQAITGRDPLALARHDWEGLAVWRDGAEDVAPLDALQTARVAVVCGIGNPAAFTAQARGCAQVVMVEPVADHAAWSPALFAGVVERALAAGATALLTTEKDFVKWRPLLAQLHLTLPVYRPLLAMQFPQGGEALATLLASHIPLSNPRTAS